MTSLTFMCVLEWQRVQSTVKRFYSPGLLLCRQLGLILTLAAAAGWAAVCYRTHMADAAGHKDMWLGVGWIVALPKL
jgi:hypothetical protein